MIFIYERNKKKYNATKKGTDHQYLRTESELNPFSLRQFISISLLLTQLVQRKKKDSVIRNEGLIE